MMIKKYVVALILSIATLTAVHPVSAEITPWQSGGVYARATVITEIEWGEDGVNLITVEDCNGFQYSYWDDADDLLEGDIMSCIFDENGTEEVTDDIIVSARYDRPDLLMERG